MLHEIKRITSKRGPTVVIIYQNPASLQYHVCIVPGRFPCWSDWSVRNPNGFISYDAPAKIPQYARPMVTKAYAIIDDLKTNGNS